MIRMQTWQAAQPHRYVRDTENFKGFLVPFLGSPSDAETAPQAYLVEQQPNWILKPHFHVQQQFQLFSAGSGFLGRHPIEPLTVHYAAPETGYGPITAGPTGLSYFSLRLVPDTAAWYLPESRTRMRAGLAKRQLSGGPVKASSDETLRSRRTLSTEVLIQPSDDGPAAWMLRVPANARTPADLLSGDEPRFCYVAGGTMRTEQAELTLTPRSMAFLSKGEPFVLEAGEQGLEVLVLQFPPTAASFEMSYPASPSVARPIL